MRPSSDNVAITASPVAGSDRRHSLCYGWFVTGASFTIVLVSMGSTAVLVTSSSR